MLFLRIAIPEALFGGSQLKQGNCRFQFGFKEVHTRAVQVAPPLEVDHPRYPKVSTFLSLKRKGDSEPSALAPIDL